MTLGEKISKQRRENNLTQEQLADILNVSRQSISKWESDTVFPEIEKLIEISKLFKCSTDYLLKEELTEKDSVQSSAFAEKMEEIGKKMMTEKNLNTGKKLLKVAGIAFSVLLAVDVISMIVYFLLVGMPK